MTPCQFQGTMSSAMSEVHYLEHCRLQRALAGLRANDGERAPAHSARPFLPGKKWQTTALAVLLSGGSRETALLSFGDLGSHRPKISLLDNESAQSGGDTQAPVVSCRIQP